MHNHWKRALAALLLAALAPALLACAGPASPTPAGDRLRVVATTTIVGDVVRQIGGEHIELTVLLAPGIDPHAFQPTPQDVAAVSQAQVVFVNGVGLEEFMAELIQHAGGSRPVVAVSDGVVTRALAGAAADEHGHEDPHVWFSPANVAVWAGNIATALGALDPAHQADYTANAAAYTAALDELDTWIAAQAQQVPADRRKLVTDHRALGYFADRYGFELVGTVVKGFSSAAAPSAQEVAQLEQEIRQYQAPAIFVGLTVNPRLSQRIAEDTGIQLVPLYTGSLSAPGGEADSYVSMMRYDVTAIVTALR